MKITLLEEILKSKDVYDYEELMNKILLLKP